MPKVIRVKAGKNLKNSVQQAVAGLGGFKKFVKTGDVVLIKPNFNTADPFPASSDPEFIKAVVQLVFEAGAKSVIVGDSSTYYTNTRKIMKKAKLFDLQKMEPSPKIFVFEERKWVKKEIPNPKFIKRVFVPEVLDEADKLI